MILIVTALMIEASPIIEYFKLKKDLSVHAFQVYRNTEIALIISGVGKVKSAMAAVYLISICNAGKMDILINIGFCGAGSNDYDLGTLLLIHKITDMDTGKDYYPDVFWENTLPRESLQCYSKALRKEALKEEPPVYCDMESAGIMEAAKKFVYAHNIVILKVISDFLNPDNLNKEQLKVFIIKHMPQLEKVITVLKKVNEPCSNFSLEEEKLLCDKISENLKFSENMRQKLFKELKKAKLKEIEPIKILEYFKDANVNSKQEGKKIFEQIIQLLKQ